MSWWDNIARVLPFGPRSETPPFTYQALESDQHIRLLRLHPGKTNAPLLGSLETYHIDSCPNYTAVSYTWGIGTKQAAHEIGITSPEASELRTSGISIKDNLHAFLTWLRDPRHDRLLWIDAVCINQELNIEKNHQVRLMGRIYQNAIKVEASLGLTRSHPDWAYVVRAFRFIQAVGEHSVPPGGGIAAYHGLQVLTPAQDYLNSPTHVFDQVKAWERGAAIMDEWQCLAKFCKQSYWTRKWILQEVILARTIVLHIEGSILSMKVVEEFFDQVRGNPYSLFWGDNTYHRFEWQRRYSNATFFSSTACLLARHRLSHRTGQGVPDRLMELLPRYAANECTVQSDHVYALFNLIGKHRKHLEIDYDQHYTQRVISVLDFLRQHDGLRAKEVAAWAICLLKLLQDKDVHLAKTKSTKDPLQQSPNRHKQLPIILAKMKWRIQFEEESSMSAKARQQMPSLAALPTLTLATQSMTIRSIAPPLTGHSIVTSPRDHGFFSIRGTETLGMADTNCGPMDELWHVVGTGLLFVARPWDGDVDRKPDDRRIVGRAILFSTQDLTDTKPLDLMYMREKLNNVKSDIAELVRFHVVGKDLLELAGLALELDSSSTGVLLPSSNDETQSSHFREA